MPHGHCFLWYPQILWMHVISDALIFVSYFSIPVSLLYFARKRKDAPFLFLFYFFCAFILFCGTTHAMDIWVIWHPDYALQGIIKILTAVASVATAFIAWKIMPMALRLKSPQDLERLNAELRTAYAETERQVIERTRELNALNERLKIEATDKDTLNAQLQKALSAAEEANKAKSEFLANMSHEVRTPMNVIVGLSHVLQNTNITADKRTECLKTLQLSSQTLMDLLNDLLDISKLENRQVELEHVVFNLPKIVEEIIHIMAVRAKEKNLDIVIEHDKSADENYIGDPLRLRQIIMNLLSNAIKFTDQGTITVHIKEVKNRRKGFTDINVDIIDTGIGIPVEKQKIIFSKFSQADTSITRKFGGTGLGLSICKSLVELMGGTISVESNIGQGSQFSFTIPLYPAGSPS